MTDDDYDDYEPSCECGSSVTWMACDHCGGDGYVEVYEDDPLWYLPGDTEPCGLCDGKGGCYVCLSSPAYHDRVIAEKRAANGAQP